MSLLVDLPTLMIAYGVIFIGATLQSSIGFGLGTFAVPILLLIDPVFVPGPLLCLAFFLTVSVYWRERGAVRTQDLKWSIIGRLLGSVAGAVVLTMISDASLTVLIALLVLVALALLTSGVRLPITLGSLLGIGAVSGFMSTTASIGGPPMAMLYYGETGPRIRGTLSGIFIAGTLVSLMALAVVGRFGWNEVVLAVALLPPLFLGYGASHYSARLLDRGFIRPAIVVVSGIAAVITLIRYLK